MVKYLDSVSTDQLEGVKLALFLLYIVATIGVIVGVYFESERFSPATKDNGWKLLIISLALETLFTVAIFSLDSGISRRQKAEIATLEELVAGRQLSPASADAAVRELKPFAGQKMYISSFSGDAEAARLGMQIRAALERAGIRVFNHLGRATAGPGGPDFGVHVTSLPVDNDFADALVKAIGKDGKIQVSDKILPAGIHMEDDSTTGIMVALRPL